MRLCDVRGIHSQHTPRRYSFVNRNLGYVAFNAQTSALIVIVPWIHMWPPQDRYNIHIRKYCGYLSPVHELLLLSSIESFSAEGAAELRSLRGVESM
ncbi:hypothetical protein GDO78_013751 [Eleutherodactylus coqui]|uniref:Uncharacterized protein n=1 Tax=Eleutherodactylus coqui TaxID=57060 RepID=A0A8J6E542_ELECQ|nr:hypothetical protein GDO78_013751 [Eleutherodactylus coqui]